MKKLRKTNTINAKLPSIDYKCIKCDKVFHLSHQHRIVKYLTKKVNSSKSLNLFNFINKSKETMFSILENSYANSLKILQAPLTKGLFDLWLLCSSLLLSRLRPLLFSFCCETNEVRGSFVALATFPY